MPANHRLDGPLQCLVLACQIAVWLTSANPGLQAHNFRFDPHHIKAVVDTINEESNFKPCAVSGKSRRRPNGVHEGLFQFRDERREAMHKLSGVPYGQCVPAEAQVRFMIQELISRREGPAFFKAKSYRAARDIFVRRYEVQLRTIKQRQVAR